MSADLSPLQLGFCAGLTKLLQHDYCLGFPANPGARTDIRLRFDSTPTVKFFVHQGISAPLPPRVEALEYANKCSWIKLMRTGANGQSADR